MGNLVMPEYERLEDEALPVETEAGGVKHNGSTVLETRTPPFGRQTRHPEAIEPDATMANNLHDEIAESQTAAASSDGCELDLAFGAPVEETPLWVDLYESIRDVFFPPKLPPLELTSTPIPVPDRMAVKPNPWAIGISTTVNVTFLLIVLFLMGRKIIETMNKPHLQATPIDVTDWNAPKASISAGGGGGSPDKIEAIKGKIPPRAKDLDVAPKLDEPPLPTIDVQNDIIIPDNMRLPNFGVSNSANVKLASGGNGSGMGLGSGNGDGYGSGSGWNIGGGLARVGGGVSAPEVTHHVDPEFSDEARRAKYQGVCIVTLIVDAQGNPQNPHVTRALGMGLDEKAIDAIKQFKFKPAYDKDKKKTVAVMVSIEINFRLY
jgi:TonB family protein